MHVGGGRERRGGRGNGQPGNGKGKGKKGGKGQEREEKQAGRFEGESRYCRKMLADLAAGRCDKVANQSVSTRSRLQAEATSIPSELCTKRSRILGEHHPDATDGLGLLPESHQLHQHDGNISADSQGGKLGRARSTRCWILDPA